MLSFQRRNTSRLVATHGFDATALVRPDGVEALSAQTLELADPTRRSGVDICHETVRLWWNRFGPMFAAEIRKKRVDRMHGNTHWKWRLDEVYVKINGEMRYLWRAVDHEGEAPESYATTTRDRAAALAFIKRAMKRHGRTQVVVTDGLKSSRSGDESGPWSDFGK